MLLKRALGQNGLRAARSVSRIGRWFPRVTERVQGNKQFTADLYPLGIAGCVRHLRRTQQFFADADAGTLPGFCIVDPDFDVFSEENPQDIRKGESFAAEVINRVMHGKGWEHTLLIWVYDEGGGYYDHVPPPEAVPAGRRTRPQPAAGGARVGQGAAPAGARPRTCARSGPRTRARTTTTGSGSGSRR